MKDDGDLHLLISFSKIQGNILIFLKSIICKYYMYTSIHTEDSQCKVRLCPMPSHSAFQSPAPGSTTVTSYYFLQLRYFLHPHSLTYLLSMFGPFKTRRKIYLDVQVHQWFIEEARTSGDVYFRAKSRGSPQATSLSLFCYPQPWALKEMTLRVPQ